MKRKLIGYVIRSLSVFARTTVLEAWSNSMGRTLNRQPWLIFQGFLCTVDDEVVKQFQFEP